MTLPRWLMAALIAVWPLPLLAQPTAETCPAFQSLGDGDDLLLVPGLGSSPQVWDGVLEGLTADYRVHLVHVAGFAGRPANGDPDTLIDRAADEIIAYLDCAAINSVAYVGHSLGGFLGLRLAAEYPDRIHRLAVVDSLPFFPLVFSPNATPASSLGQAQAIRQQILGQSDEAFERAQRAGVRSLVQAADDQDTVVGWTLASERASFAGAVHTLMTTDLRSNLNAIEAPTTVIAAANAFAPRRQVEALYSGAYSELENVDVVIVEESFHFIMLDQPERLTSALRSALTSPQSGPNR